MPVYQAGLVLTKLSILEQYRRVFVGKGITRAIYAMMGVTVVYGQQTLDNERLAQPRLTHWFRFLVCAEQRFHVYPHPLLLEHVDCRQVHERDGCLVRQCRHQHRD